MIKAIERIQSTKNTLKKIRSTGIEKTSELSLQNVSTIVDLHHSIPLNLYGSNGKLK